VGAHQTLATTMSNNPTAVLGILFRIPDEVIEKDLVRARHNIEAISKELAAILAVNRKERTHEAEAQIHHLTMIQACELGRLPDIAPEYKVFYGASGAGYVTQDAEMAAHSKGRLAELSQCMAEIQEREGLLEDEVWSSGDGPEDYEQLEEEYSKIAASIEDTIFLHALRRYRMPDLADLYEENRQEFEIQREIGRRLIFGSESGEVDMEEFMDQSIKKRFGDEALARVRHRVSDLQKRRG